MMLLHMATPRSKLVDPDIALHYHLVSSCVRRSWLCGKDPYTGKDYSHRKVWIESRMFHLAQFFAVEIDAYAIMSNHLHLVVYYDPIASKGWDDDEVARRWVDAFPPKEKGKVVEALKTLAREQILEDAPRLAACRERLGSLSAFMQHFKQPIAWLANQEDGCSGHFFEQRFYSGALLNEAALFAAMAYVDLNPVRAKIAKSIEDCDHTSISRRLRQLENTPERLAQTLTPLVSGSPRRFGVTLAEYIERLDAVVQNEATDSRLPASALDGPARWIAQVAAFRKRQRAYGTSEGIAQWIERRRMRPLESALPG